MVVDRRRFLQTAGAGLLGASLWRCGYHEVIPLIDGVEVPFVSAIGEHYVKNGAEGSLRGWRMPDLDPAGWSLVIDGLVERPQTLTLADLEAEAAANGRVELLKTMQCVVDSAAVPGLVGTARWGGVPLLPWLERAGIDRSRAKRLHLFGADDFTGNIPLDRLDVFDGTDGIAYGIDGISDGMSGGRAMYAPLLVTHMNGEPLPRSHGAPVRLVMADAYGYANIKWLTRITATDDDSAFGTYQDAGFTDEATSPVLSKMTAPIDNARLPSGPMTLHGFAVSGAAAVEAVEVRIDGGEWQRARLATRAEVRATAPLVDEAVQITEGERFGWPLRGVWAIWSLEWDAPPGKHLIELRARDHAGGVQPEIDFEIADGVNAIAVTRVEIDA